MTSLPTSPYIRPAEPDDALEISQLFFDTVHQVNCRDYNAEQIAAWAPQRDDEARFRLRQQTRITFVAITGNQIIGFAEFEVIQREDTTPLGRIDCFYVHQAAQRQGAGTLLMQRLQIEAYLRQISELTAEVSLTAKPFFEHHQFAVIQQQEVFRENVAFTNFLMKTTVFANVSPALD